MNCIHENMVENTDIGILQCYSCGYIEEIILFTVEYKNYSSVTKRCSVINNKQNKGFRKIISDSNISLHESTLSSSEYKFNMIIKDIKIKKEIIRGSERKALAAACCFYTFMEYGNPKTSNEICKIFNIHRKMMSHGQTNVLCSFPKFRILHVNAENITKNILTKIGITDDYNSTEIIKFISYIKNSSVKIIRSNPESVAASCIYYYLSHSGSYKKCENIEVKKTEDLKYYTKLIGVSEITINNILKEIKIVII